MCVRVRVCVVQVRLWYDEAAQTISWKADSIFASSKSIAISEIKELWLGRYAPAFPKTPTVEEDPSVWMNSMTIHCKGRTLDICSVDSGAMICQAIRALVGRALIVRDYRTGVLASMPPSARGSVQIAAVPIAPAVLEIPAGPRERRKSLATNMKELGLKLH